MADKPPAATSTPTITPASTAPEPAKPTPFTGFNFGGTQTPATGGGFSSSGIQAIGSTPSAPSAFSLNTSLNDEMKYNRHQTNFDGKLNPNLDLC